MDKMENYEILELLGKGSQGVVFKCLYKDKKRKTEKIIAMKRIMVSSMKEATKAIKELLIVQNLSNPHVAKYLSLFFNENLGLVLVCIVMEFYEGDLEGYISNFYQKNKEKRIPEDVVRSIILQITEGLSFLHENNLIHRDLKPQNIFIKYEDKNQQKTNNKNNRNFEGNLKIGDFGLSTRFSKDSLKSTFCGSSSFIAPELLMNKKYSYKVDLFALGVIIFYLCTGEERIFYIELMSDLKKTMNYIFSRLKDHYSREIINLVLNLVSIDPVGRLEAKEIIEYFSLEEKTKLRKKRSIFLLDDPLETIKELITKTKNNPNILETLPKIIEDDTKRKILKDSQFPDKKQEKQKEKTNFIDVELLGDGLSDVSDGDSIGSNEEEDEESENEENREEDKKEEEKSKFFSSLKGRVKNHIERYEKKAERIKNDEISEYEERERELRKDKNQNNIVRKKFYSSKRNSKGYGTSSPRSLSPQSPTKNIVQSKVEENKEPIPLSFKVENEIKPFNGSMYFHRSGENIQKIQKIETSRNSYRTKARQSRSSKKVPGVRLKKFYSSPKTPP